MLGLSHARLPGLRRSSTSQGTRQRRLYVGLLILLVGLLGMFALPSMDFDPSSVIRSLNHLEDNSVEAAALKVTDVIPSEHIIFNREAGNESKKEEFRKVWADDRISNTTLPAPYDNYRWTFLHATTYTDRPDQRPAVEFVTFIEETPAKQNKGQWQIALPNIPDIVKSASCHFVESGEITAAAYQWQYRQGLRLVLLFSCSTPSTQMLDVDQVNLELQFQEEAGSFSHEVRLQSRQVSPVVKDSIGICVSPLYGAVDNKKLLEWRLHHARLGVSAVHWYDRSNHEDTKRMIQFLNEAEGLKDTWRDAPCISPETCGTDLLEAQGLAGDQVLYYVDCISQARHTHPTEWLAMIDVDEFVLPEPYNKASDFQDFLSKQGDHVGAVCFHRYTSPDATAAAQTLANETLALERVDSMITANEVDRRDNTKCIYRSKSASVPWIHWEAAFRKGQPDAVLQYRNDNDPIRLLHLSSNQGAGPFKTRFQPGIELQSHFSNVRQAIRRTVDKMPDIW